MPSSGESPTAVAQPSLHRKSWKALAVEYVQDLGRSHSQHLSTPVGHVQHHAALSIISRGQGSKELDPGAQSTSAERNGLQRSSARSAELVSRSSASSGIVHHQQVPGEAQHAFKQTDLREAQKRSPDPDCVLAEAQHAVHKALNVTKDGEVILRYDF